MRFINDHKGLADAPNAQFFIADENVGGYDVAAVVALREIKPGEEILVSYGEGYWNELISFACSKCDYKTTSKKTLDGHVHRRHVFKKRFQCEFCSRIFVSKSGFDDHVNSQHTGTYIYWCQECNYSTLSRANLVTHNSKKHTLAVIKCFECSRTFSTQFVLRRHVETIHKKV